MPAHWAQIFQSIIILFPLTETVTNTTSATTATGTNVIKYLFTSKIHNNIIFAVYHIRTMLCRLIGLRSNQSIIMFFHSQE